MKVKLKNIKRKALKRSLFVIALFIVGLTVSQLMNHGFLHAGQETTFLSVTKDGKTLTKDSVLTDDSVTLTLTSDTNRLVKLPASADYDIGLIQEGKETGLPITAKTDFDQEQLLTTLGITTTGSTAPPASSTTSSSATAQSSSSPLTSSTAIAVAQTDPKQPTDTYLELVKGSPLTLVVHHTSQNAVAVVASDVTQNLTQTLFQMGAPSEESRSSESTDTIDGKKVLNVTTATADEATKAITDPNNYRADDSLIKPVYVPDASAKKEVAAPSTDATSTQASSPKAQAYSLPKTAIKSMTEAFKPNTAKVETLSTNPNSPIVIQNGTATVQDGTATFDSDNNPGHDANGSNGVVRSWDQIIYLVSFAVQNNSNATYGNIKYSIQADLNGAVTLGSDGKTPQVNAEIASGTMYNTDGTSYTGGAGYSEGIMQSSINNTGQVFVPVIVNVYGAPNGYKLQPTFKVSIISADNQDTQETEGTTNNPLNTYDGTDFSQFSPSATTVSAAPSIGVTLVKGQTQAGTTVFGGTNSNLDADDVAAVIALQPLAEHKSWTNPYVGATYPTGSISYSLSNSGTYTPSTGAATALTTSQMASPTVNAYAPATLNRTSGFTYNSGSGYASKYTQALSAPNANTGQINTTQPVSNLASQGVYNSGTFTASSAGSVTNTNYSGVYSPYTYNMTGAITPTALAKSFSSMEMILGWDRTITQNLAVANNWTSYTYNLTVSTITYNDANGNSQTLTNNGGTLSYTTNYKPDGSYTAAVGILTRLYNSATIPSKQPNIDNSSSTISYSDVSGGTGTNYQTSQTGSSMLQNYGDSLLYTGEKVNLEAFESEKQSTISIGNNYLEEVVLSWDPTVFSYDPAAGYDMFIGNNYSTFNALGLQFGVATNFSATAPVTMTALPLATTLNQYTWYPNWAAVVAAGVQNSVSAVHLKINNNGYGTSVANGSLGSKNIGIPAIVKQGVSGSKTPAGNPLVLMGTFRDTSGDGTKTFDPIVNNPTGNIVNNTTNAANVGQYIPTTFNSDGTVNNKNGTIGGSTVQQLYWNAMGESAFVKPFSITSRTNVTQATYQTSQDVSIKVQGIPSGSSATTYDSNLVTTLPVGIHYKSGSAVDATGNPLPDPTMTTDASGREVLRWNFNQMSQTLMATGTEVDFKATSDISKLSFNSQGLTGTLTVSTIASMWIDGQPANVDGTGSIASVRGSVAGFVEQLIQQVTLNKVADKTAIEDGTNDPAISDSTARAASTDITYTITGGNYSVNAQPALTIMDVLPYSGDSRGSNIHGSYTVQSVKIVDTNGNDTGGKDSAGNPVYLNYTDNAPNTAGSNNYNEKTNPNTIMGTPPSSGTWSATQTGWQSGTPDANTKAIIAADPLLAVGASITLQITIRPTGQQAGDVYNNRAVLNSNIINSPVSSQNFKTTVYGRDLSGFAWRDVNHDGLYESGESKLSGVPVKLYRTSLINSNLANQVVTSDLKGNSFVDSSSNSTVLTGSDGSYTFSNLPEGTYVAEFEIDGMIQKKQFVVTNPNVGTALPINSKSAQNSPYNTATSTYGTDSDLDTLQSLSGLSDSTELNYLSNDTYHMQYANLGVVQGEIYLLKFKLGTTVDANNDGNPDIDSNYHLTQGTALEGASFNLLDDKGNILSSLSTDAYGQIHFTNIAPGKYTLVETKAPTGYELLKVPIPVTVDMSQNNGTSVVFAADAPMTTLPYTGANGPMGTLLIMGSIVLLLGMGYVTYEFYFSKKRKVS